MDIHESSRFRTIKVRKKGYFYLQSNHISSNSKYSCIKMNLNSILKENLISPRDPMIDAIKNAVRNMHIIVNQSSFFLKTLSYGFILPGSSI